MHNAFIAALALLLAGCSSVISTPTEMITLDHFGGMIPGPIYSINVFSNGVVRFTGEKRTLFLGSYSSRINVDTVKNLIIEAHSILLPAYKVQNWEYPIDAGPFARIKLYIDTELVDLYSKTAPVDLGCFQEHLIKATRAIRWIGSLRDLQLIEAGDTANRFAGADSLQQAMRTLDSLYHASKLDYHSWISTRSEPGQEWYRRKEVYQQPIRDSLQKFIMKRYEQYTEPQIDSIANFD